MRAASILLATFAIALVSTAAQTRVQRPRSIFNGKNLDGWQGNPALWSVIDGVITGKTTADGEGKLDQNSFLIYRGGEPVTDFELSLKVRVTGNNNSGVQYRSRVVDKSKFTVSGYQLDIHPKPSLVGMIYEERGRGVLAQRGRSTRASTEKVQPVGSHRTTEKIDIAEWNEYTIIARGNLITHKINGTVTSTLRDDNLAKRSLRGVIALQLHAGAPMQVEAKDIILRRLARATPAAPKEARTSTTHLPKPKWIKPATAEAAGQSSFFRHAWRPKSPIETSVLHIAASGDFQVFLNGKSVGQGTGDKKAHQLDLSPQLNDFNNRIAISVAPGEGPASLAVQIDFTHADNSRSRIVSDSGWLSLASNEAPGRWTELIPERRNWQASTTNAEVPSPDFSKKDRVEQGEEKTRLTPAGFNLEKVYEIPANAGDSWVALTSGPKGKLFASAQNGGVFQIDFSDSEKGIVVERVQLDIDHANGLVWAFGKLYASVNHPAKSGLYSLSDSNGDGTLDRLETLRRLTGSGVNGPHGLALSPMLPSLYLACGNRTELAEPFTRRRVPDLYRDDQLLTSPSEDTPTPGGWIAMTRSAGVEWELHAAGLRNPYDLAFNRHGDLFTCDASLPEDQGTPFFRPSSIYHLPNGIDLGARGVAQNFSRHYQDTIPPVIELKPGEPSGLTFGYGTKFPAKFQEALFVGDRSNSSITAVHLKATGSSYSATSEPFITAPDLSVEDITIGSDGAMYFVGISRETTSALWRISYSGDEATTPTTLQPFTPHAERKQAQLKKLGLLQGIKDKRAVATAWRHLADSDRMIRYSARTAIEHHPAELTLELMTEESNPNAIIEACTAITRIGLAEHQSTVVEKLGTLDFATLNSAQKITYLRALGLTFIRLSPPTANQQKQLVEKISPAFPSRTEELDLELARMLIYLSAPTAISPTLELLNSTKFPESAAAYATFLSHAKDGWTPEANANYLAWFKTTAEQGGSKNRQIYLNRLKSAFFREDPQKNE